MFWLASGKFQPKNPIPNAKIILIKPSPAIIPEGNMFSLSPFKTLAIKPPKSKPPERDKGK